VEHDMTKHKTEEERMMLCQAWQQSALTQREFCKQNNIGKKSFYRWLSKLRNNSKTTIANAKDTIESAPIKFLRVGNAIPECFTSEKSFLEITLPNGINFKASIIQDSLNNFLQELLKWK
jgi:hypothetical protein